MDGVPGTGLVAGSQVRTLPQMCELLDGMLNRHQSLSLATLLTPHWHRHYEQLLDSLHDQAEELLHECIKAEARVRDLQQVTQSLGVATTAAPDWLVAMRQQGPRLFDDLLDLSERKEKVRQGLSVQIIGFNRQLKKTRAWRNAANRRRILDSLGYPPLDHLRNIYPGFSASAAGC